MDLLRDLLAITFYAVAGICERLGYACQRHSEDSEADEAFIVALSSNGHHEAEAIRKETHE